MVKLRLRPCYTVVFLGLGSVHLKRKITGVGIQFRNGGELWDGPPGAGWERRTSASCRLRGTHDGIEEGRP